MTMSSYTSFDHTQGTNIRYRLTIHIKPGRWEQSPWAWWTWRHFLGLSSAATVSIEHHAIPVCTHDPYVCRGERLSHRAKTHRPVSIDSNKLGHLQNVLHNKIYWWFITITIVIFFIKYSNDIKIQIDENKFGLGWLA